MNPQNIIVMTMISETGALVTIGQLKDLYYPSSILVIQVMLDMLVWYGFNAFWGEFLRMRWKIENR